MTGAATTIEGVVLTQGRAGEVLADTPNLGRVWITGTIPYDAGTRLRAVGRWEHDEIAGEVVLAATRVTAIGFEG